jgi:hypothetical protein
VPEILVRMGHDAPGGSRRLRLGDHGFCEMSGLRELRDGAEAGLLAAADGELFGPDGSRAGMVAIIVNAIDERSCEVVLESAARPGATPHRELRRAVVRELSEDLLFHAARARDTAA